MPPSRFKAALWHSTSAGKSQSPEVADTKEMPEAVGNAGRQSPSIPVVPLPIPCCSAVNRLFCAATCLESSLTTGWRFSKLVPCAQVLTRHALSAVFDRDAASQPSARQEMRLCWNRAPPNQPPVWPGQVWRAWLLVYDADSGSPRRQSNCGTAMLQSLSTSG